MYDVKILLIILLSCYKVRRNGVNIMLTIIGLVNNGVTILC